MPQFVLIILSGLTGYLIAAVAGYWIVNRFSPNRHDRAVEAAMTGAFVFGPLGAIAAVVVTLFAR